MNTIASRVYDKREVKASINTHFDIVLSMCKYGKCGMPFMYNINGNQVEVFFITLETGIC